MRRGEDDWLGGVTRTICKMVRLSQEKVLKLSGEALKAISFLPLTSLMATTSWRRATRAEVTVLCLIRHLSFGLYPLLGTTVEDKPSGLGGVLLAAVKEVAWTREPKGCGPGWFFAIGVYQYFLGLATDFEDRVFGFFARAGGR